MTTITDFNRANLKNIHADINKALAEVSKKYGITIGTGGIRFSANDFTCRITALVKNNIAGNDAAEDSASNVNPNWQVAFLRNAVWMGLKKDDLGKSFKLRGEIVKLVGARVKATYPLVVQKTNGRCIAVGTEEVIAALGK